MLLISLAAVVTLATPGLQQQAPPPTQRPATLPGRPPAEEADSARRSATLDGHAISYIDKGEGTAAVVFVHGWACDAEFWNGQIDAFAARGRAIAIDLPGHGQSAKPTVTYTQDLFARAIDAVLTDAGVERAVLVGHSLGAVTITTYQQRYPARVSALVLADGSFLPPAAAEQMKTFVDALGGPDAFKTAATMIDGMLGPVKDEANRTFIRQRMLSTPARVRHTSIASIGDDVFAVKRIDVPVLAVLVKSPGWGADTDQKMKAIAPNATIVWWDDTSHFLMMDKPAAFNDLVIGWLGNGSK